MEIVLFFTAFYLHQQQQVCDIEIEITKMTVNCCRYTFIRNLYIEEEGYD